MEGPRGPLGPQGQGPQERPRGAPEYPKQVGIRSWAPLWGLLTHLGSSWGILGGLLGPLARIPTVYEPFLVLQEVAKRLQEHPKKPEEEPKRAPKARIPLRFALGLLFGASWLLLGPLGVFLGAS